MNPKCQEIFLAFKNETLVKIYAASEPDSQHWQAWQIQGAAIRKYHSDARFHKLVDEVAGASLMLARDLAKEAMR